MLTQEINSCHTDNLTEELPQMCQGHGWLQDMKHISATIKGVNQVERDLQVGVGCHKLPPCIVGDDFMLWVNAMDMDNNGVQCHLVVMNETTQ